MTQVLSGSSSINGLYDEHTFQDLADIVGTRLATVDADNPANLTLDLKFNSIEDDVTVDALTAFIKQQEALPTASGKARSAPVATDPTNGSWDTMTVGEVVRFIMVENDLPEEQE